MTKQQQSVDALREELLEQLDKRSEGLSKESWIELCATLEYDISVRREARVRDEEVTRALETYAWLRARNVVARCEAWPTVHYPLARAMRDPVEPTVFDRGVSFEVLVEGRDLVARGSFWGAVVPHDQARWYRDGSVHQACGRELKDFEVRRIVDDVVRVTVNDHGWALLLETLEELRALVEREQSPPVTSTEVGAWMGC